VLAKHVILGNNSSSSTDDNEQRQVEQLLMEMEAGENEDFYDFDNG
jgi:hypothetical protein